MVRIVPMRGHGVQVHMADRAIVLVDKSVFVEVREAVQCAPILSPI
jgi:hypothetical protein